MKSSTLSEGILNSSCHQKTHSCGNILARKNKLNRQHRLVWMQSILQSFNISEHNNKYALEDFSFNHHFYDCILYLYMFLNWLAHDNNRVLVKIKNSFKREK